MRGKRDKKEEEKRTDKYVADAESAAQVVGNSREWDTRWDTRGRREKIGIVVTPRYFYYHLLRDCFAIESPSEIGQFCF